MVRKNVLRGLLVNSQHRHSSFSSRTFKCQISDHMGTHNNILNRCIDDCFVLLRTDCIFNDIVVIIIKLPTDHYCL